MSNFHLILQILDAEYFCESDNCFDFLLRIICGTGHDHQRLHKKYLLKYAVISGMFSTQISFIHVGPFVFLSLYSLV